MEDPNILSVPLKSELADDCYDEFHDPMASSGGSIGTGVEEPLSGDFCVDPGITSVNDQLLSRNYVNDGQDPCMYNEGPSNYDHHSDIGMNDDEDDGLYLALNSIPVTVEIEEESTFITVKHDADEMDIVKHEADEMDYIGEDTASASWYDASDVTDELELKESDSALMKKKKKKRKTFYGDIDKRERERITKRKDMAKERAQKYRDSLTPEQRKELRERDKERTKNRRMMMTEEESLVVRIKNRENAQMRRMDATYKDPSYGRKSESLDSDEEKAILIREKNRERMRLKRLKMSEEEKTIERQKNRERVRKKRQIQRAEALLKKLIGVHPDLVKLDSAGESHHFLQSVLDVDSVAEKETTINDC